jgi:hypothetical protein
MSIIRPVGGILGPRPTGASFRTGVWKQQEVFERRVDGVWATPSYPDLAPYATNANGEILVGTYNPGKKTTTGSTQVTRDYVKPSKTYGLGGLCLDGSRWTYLNTQAVTNSLNWRFTIRYYDEPTGSNVFGLSPQSGNVKRVASGNSCYNMADFRIDYEPSGNFDSLNTRYLWHDEVSGCDTTGVDYNLLGTYNSQFSYTTTTTGGPSSARWPFGQATDNYYTAGVGNPNVSYTNLSQSNRAVSIWLLPP